MISVRVPGEKNGRKKQSECLKQRLLGPAICCVKALSANGTDQEKVC